MAELLEYLVSLRGGAAAAAEMRGLSGEVKGLAASQRKLAASGDAAAASSGKLGGAIRLLGKGTAAVGVALVGIGLEAVKASTTFNHEMLRIRTDAGASTAELRRMKVGVLDLASSGASMGQGPNSLAEGLYHLESLGIRGAKALDALKLASQESAISGANLEQTTSALGAAIFVGIKGTGNLKQTMGILNATVGAGNMRMQELVDSLGTGILASAKVAGLSIRDVGAALAVLSDGGQNASSGAAQLATALHFLYAPSMKGETALESIGLTGSRMAADMRKPQGLLVALRDLHDHMGKLSKISQEQTLSAILPGGRGRVLLSLMEQLDRLHGKYQQIAKTAGGFGGSVAQQRKDPQTQLKTQEAALQANLVRLGNLLQPIVVPGLIAITKAGNAVLGWMIRAPAVVQGVISWFSQLVSGSGTVGNSLRSVGSTASELWSTISSTFTQIGQAAGHLFNNQMVNDLKVIGKHLLAFGALVMRILGPTLQTLIRAFGTLVRGVFDLIGGAIKIVAGLLTGDFSKAWDGVKQILAGVASFISGTLHAAFAVWLQPIITVVTGLVNKLANVLSGPLTTAFQAVTSWVSNQFNSALQTAVSIVNWFIGAINTAIDGINTLINGFNSVAGSIPFVGGSLTVGSIHHVGAIPQAPAPALNLNTSVGGAKSGASGQGHIQGNLARYLGAARATVALPAGAASRETHAHITIPLSIAGREVARAVRHEVIREMAAGA